MKKEAKKLDLSKAELTGEKLCPNVRKLIHPLPTKLSSCTTPKPAAK